MENLVKKLEEQITFLQQEISLIGKELYSQQKEIKDLKNEIAEGRFREDLYHRLAVIIIHVPSLANRKQDIPILTEYFVNMISKEQGIENKNFTKEALVKLNKYEWTGNVRELRNVIERLMILGDNPVSEDNIIQFASK